VDNHESRAPYPEFQGIDVLFELIWFERLTDDSAPGHADLRSGRPWQDVAEKQRTTGLLAVGL
jgi:hypothetical protein